jgi:hypothetical protein
MLFTPPRPPIGDAEQLVNYIAEGLPHQPLVGPVAAPQFGNLGLHRPVAGQETDAHLLV